MPDLDPPVPAVVDERSASHRDHGATIEGDAGRGRSGVIYGCQETRQFRVWGKGGRRGGRRAAGSLRPLAGLEAKRKKRRAAAREGTNLGKSEGGADSLNYLAGYFFKGGQDGREAARRRERRGTLAGCWLLAAGTRLRRSEGQDLGQRHVKGGYERPACRTKGPTY